MKTLLFLLVAAALLAGDGTPFYRKDSDVEYSPNRDVMVEQYQERQGAHQIWLVSTADPAKRRLLFTHERSADVLFSSDQEWLVINNHNLSNESRLLLYSRKGPLEYVESADLTETAWKYFGKRNGPEGEPPFDHNYVSALRWAESDPPVLLLCLQGHADSRNFTSEWYSFYNVRDRKFHTGLDAHNKAVTKLE